jgi:hypothetical protein
MNEMSRLERFRAEVPRPGLADLGVEERRLLGAIADPAAPRRRIRPARLTLAAGLTVGIAAAGVAVVVSDREPAPAVHAMPAAVVQVLTRAADNVGRAPELHPRPGQFLAFESVTMNTVESNDKGGHQSRYLSREKRTIWLPVEGDATHGVLESEGLPPKPYPGWPIPPEARREVGRSGPEKAVDEDNRVEWLRTDYAYLSRLPTDPGKMYEHLYAHLGNDPMADIHAWDDVGSMLTEAYLPAAQRAALFRAAAAIHGVTTVGRATDAAGRAGIAVAMLKPKEGVRDEYLFDPATYQYLGRRSTVTDADEARAPVGSVLTSTAQLRVRVVDHPPALARK